MQKKQGISLIVLVITIIVMIILAGAIILSLNNSGIINKATGAVEETNLATVRELTQMAWAEAYARGERTEEDLKAAVDKALEDNKVDGAKYIIEVTTSGVTVELKGEPKVKWVQQGLTVTNGTVTLEIGDSIAYDETNGGTITGLTATDWKVLGASEEGELLIMSTSDVDYIKLGSEDMFDLTKSQQDWLNGPNILDNICNAYGKGLGATGARSVRIDDIDKVTGFDKTTYEVGHLDEYGNEITYSYNGTFKPSFEAKNGRNGTLDEEHTIAFHFYNGIEFVRVNDISAGIEGQIFATIKSEIYRYYLDDFEISKEAVLLIFGDYDEETGEYSNRYWLASVGALVTWSYVNFEMFVVNTANVMGECLWDSYGYADYNEYGVRVVVHLEPNINITGSSIDGWEI